MAVNPELDPNGMPVPFFGEMLVLSRSGIEFHVNHLACLGGKSWSARGMLYLSTVRMVFVSGAPEGPVKAFDLPLLYVHGEQFNQPIFGCNNVTGRILPVHAGDRALPHIQLPHDFTVYFKEGGVGTFLPRFFGLLRSIRAGNPVAAGRVARAMGPQQLTVGGTQDEAGERAGPMPQAQGEQAMQSIRSAFVDPNDPSIVYVEQPPCFAEGAHRGSY